jgi:hypothetical protein
MSQNQPWPPQVNGDHELQPAPNWNEASDKGLFKSLPIDKRARRPSSKTLLNPHKNWLVAAFLVIMVQQVRAACSDGTNSCIDGFYLNGSVCEACPAGKHRF